MSETSPINVEKKSWMANNSISLSEHLSSFVFRCFDGKALVLGLLFHEKPNTYGKSYM